LLWLGTSKLHCIGVGKAVITVSFLTLAVMVSVVLRLAKYCLQVCVYSLYYVENSPSIPSFCKTFIMNGCWILSKVFSVFVKRIMWFLSLLLLICFITFID
jgi:hypothetical protein